MRLVFAGTPAVAVPTLQALVASDHDVVAVVTREDAPTGRKRVLTPSPVADAAAALGIPVIKANRLDAVVTERIAALSADLGVIVAYGGLVREPLLSTPVHGWINLHFSLLPSWRGAAPVQRSIMGGDRVTGAAVFQLVAALDAGPVFDRIETPIGETETAGELLERLAIAGGPLTLSVVDAIAAGTAIGVEQSGDVTLAPKLGSDDARIDWTKDAVAVDALIRGVTPEPGAHTTIDGTRFKIHRATLVGGNDADADADAQRLAPGVIVERDGQILIGTATTPLRLHTVQPAGKTAMAAADWWRGIDTESLVAS
ncbi:methionyl-tRNA formyltransferase [Plantibacter sp. YIM 135347]|uniref:methionyl-tRNA formyltransferase n=1 Tax=Plantibacter sp. YIM 135347 TaxID=3423919 RepID=UPI003D34E5F1